MGEQMQFPNTIDEFIKQYSFIDKQQIYTNGSELIPVFRIKQWEEHKQQEKEELLNEIEHLKEELENFEQQVRDNYKPVSYAEQVGFNERDFI